MKNIPTAINIEIIIPSQLFKMSMGSDKVLSIKGKNSNTLRIAIISSPIEINIQLTLYLVTFMSLMAKRVATS